jgi:hypothetical protein
MTLFFVILSVCDSLLLILGLSHFGLKPRNVGFWFGVTDSEGVMTVDPRA